MNFWCWLGFHQWQPIKEWNPFDKFWMTLGMKCKRCGKEKL